MDVLPVLPTPTAALPLLLPPVPIPAEFLLPHLLSAVLKMSVLSLLALLLQILQLPQHFPELLLVLPE